VPSSQLRFAERVLMLVAPPERAMAVIGDFAEHGEAGLRLWGLVLRVAGAMLWKAIAEQRGRMACLAVVGSLMQAVFFAPLAVFVFFLVLVAVACGALLRGEATVSMNLIAYVLLVCIVVPAPWLAGRWVARRAPGRELAPCLAVAFLHAIGFTVVYAIYGNQLVLINGWTGIVPTLFLLAVSEASLFTGAAWVRERQGAALTWFERFPFDMERQGLRWWQMRITVSQQNILDRVLLFSFLAFQLDGWFPTTSRIGRGILGAALAWTLLWNAIIGRPFAGSIGGLRLWFGRLLVGGVGVWLAYSSCQEFRGR
jgi:hypothetical protein